MDIGLPKEVVEVELTEVDAPPAEQPTEAPAETPQEVEVAITASMAATATPQTT